MDVAGDDLALSPHRNGSGKGLPSRCSAYILHPVTFFGLGHHRYQMCGSVLHHKAPLRKGRQSLQIARAAHREAVLQPRMALHRDPRLLQLLHQGLVICLEQVRVNGSGNDLVVPPQELLRLLRRQNLQ